MAVIRCRRRACVSQKKILFGLQAGANELNAWLGHLGLRLLLAYEFGVAGLEKLRGENWFDVIQDRFPLPLNLVPAEYSWQMATWSELIGAAALVVGLGTRFASLALIVLTIVAWISVHAGMGYNVCDNGYKLSLIYLAMFVPLLLGGAGRLSLDALLARYLASRR